MTKPGSDVAKMNFYSVQTLLEWQLSTINYMWPFWSGTLWFKRSKNEEINKQ